MITGATSVDEANRGARIAVLPVGSFEQHGDHLPLATDTIVAEVIAARIADRYSLFRLPPVTISCSHEHEGFTGTVSVSAQTLISVIADVRASLARSDISRLVLVNGHGGNYVLSNIAQEANVSGRSVALFPGKSDIAAARDAAGMVTTADEDMHGGEWETSILLYTHPELVRDTYRDADHDAPDRPHLHLTGMGGYTKSGIIGRPSLATAEKGYRALDSLTESFSTLLDAFMD
ncbi:creatininase family protein [Actinokineospora sp. NBRC 105648]|uniref:creatininase family protein n=1 Tax=Actinokineospora sp. NBRC 105648 TaxID=3032206 RepID=UPI0024A3B8D5|nr:creatininase family protein [Actinokineospora sp. NBRC 105648]GLZ37614.1 creatinine amidohydrolase [Actinokineospora sp. NBRC 105648]